MHFVNYNCVVAIRYTCDMFPQEKSKCELPRKEFFEILWDKALKFFKPLSVNFFCLMKGKADFTSFKHNDSIVQMLPYLKSLPRSVSMNRFFYIENIQKGLQIYLKT